MDVRDRRARPRRLDRRRPRSASGVTGHARGLSRGVTRAGHRAGDEDLPVHCSPLRVDRCARERYPTAGCGIIRGREQPPTPPGRPHGARDRLRQRGRHRLRLRRSAARARRRCHDHLDDRPHRGARRGAARRGRARVHAHVADLTDRDQARALVSAAEAAHGPLDILVNNAGLAQTRRRVHGRALRRAPRRDVPPRSRAQPADRLPRHSGGAPRHAHARLRPHRDGLVRDGPAGDDAGIGRLLDGEGRRGRHDARARPRHGARRGHRQLGAARLDRDRLLDASASSRPGGRRQSGAPAAHARWPPPSRSSPATRPRYITGQTLVVDGGNIIQEAHGVDVYS